MSRTAKRIVTNEINEVMEKAEMQFVLVLLSVSAASVSLQRLEACLWALIAFYLVTVSVT